MEAVSPNPQPTPPLFGAAEALYCSQGLQSEPEEKVDFLRGAKNPPVPLGLLVVCRSTVWHTSLPYIPNRSSLNVWEIIYRLWRYPFFYWGTALIRIINCHEIKLMPLYPIQKPEQVLLQQQYRLLHFSLQFFTLHFCTPSPPNTHTHTQLEYTKKKKKKAALNCLIQY